MGNFDQMKLAVEGLSGGKNTIILDDLGMPSVMVRIPQMRYSDVVTGGTQTVLDAFILNGAALDVLYIGKYQNIVVNGRAYSLPFKDPQASLNFDTARTYCRAKGTGWHLQTNALWAAIALWSKKNGTQPRGNNNYGQDINAAHEKGIRSYPATGTINRTATGSGPNTWYHDYNNATGIADMNGNIWEWCGGLRLQNGEIQIIPYGNAMPDSFTGAQDIQGPTSSLWQAIMPDGTFVAPGTAGTLKWDYTATPAANTGNIQLISGNLANQQPDDTAYGYKLFGNLTAASGLTVPQVLKGLGLFPDGVLADYNNVGGFWFRNNGERLPIRGGSWYHGADAGVFALDLRYPRSYVSALVGFRAAFYGNP